MHNHLHLLGTIFGWLAFANIRRSNGQLIGAGLAIFDACFWPAAIVLVVLLAAFDMI